MEKALITECIKGNVFAQKRLYNAFVGKSFRICLRYIPIQADAEEVMMNGFLKIFQGLKSFEFRDKIGFEAWIKRIMVNECLLFLRKKSSVSFFDYEDIQLIDEYQNHNYGSDIELIYEVIRELPAGYRTVFNLFVIDGFTHEEIANQLKISVNTSKSQLSKGRKFLQELLLKKGIVYEN